MLIDYRKCGELEESPSFGDAPVLREILCRFQYGIDLKRGFRYGGGLANLGIYFFTDTKREAASPGYCYITAIQGTGEGERTYSYAFREIMALGFRGVPANHPDQVALNIAVSLLNNSNGTGFLDKLTVDHKVMGAMAVAPRGGCVD